MNNIKILESSFDAKIEFIHDGVWTGLPFPLPFLSIVKENGKYECCALNCIS